MKKDQRGRQHLSWCGEKKGGVGPPNRKNNTPTRKKVKGPLGKSNNWSNKRGRKKKKNVCVVRDSSKNPLRVRETKLRNRGLG